MKGRKSLFSIVTIIILILVIFLFRERDPFGKKNSSFASEPEKEITGIELSYEGSNLKLSLSGKTWYVNGKNEARKNSILFITTILEKMEIKSPVSQEMFRSEVTDKGIKPVKIKVTEGSKTLRVFFVYKTLSNAYGNIMKVRENSKPFIVFVPGSEVEIGSAFTMNEHFWEPYTIFDIVPSEIASLSFVNNADTSSSFRIVNFERKYILYGNSERIAGFDTSLVRRYLSYYTHVPFESWAPELSSEKVGEITGAKPLFLIDLIKSDGSKTNIIMWERIIEDKGMKKIDTDRLWAKIDNNTELCIVRYMDIDPLIKKRSYFSAR